MRSLKKLFVTAFLYCVSVSLQAQYYKLSGKIIDSESSEPLTGVTVVLTYLQDSTIRNYTTTDVSGNFSIANVKAQTYKLKALYVGYKRFEKVVNVNNSNIKLDTIRLIIDNKEIQEVVVIKEGPAAVQKGDTSEMSASAYKTTKDASVEDLVKKMPTITVDASGSVKAQGEAIQKVLVDGKPFFGDDQSMALKNLPAELVDKVQVYNEMSEQSRQTGFDDGNTTKTMNIVTRKSDRNGIFGKLSAGYGTDNRYIANGNVNFFNGERRTSIIGNGTNTGQSMFSGQDLVGRGGGGFGGGQGITRMNSIGVNYSDNWGSKIKATSSYFFNGSNNELNKSSSQQYYNGTTILSNDTSTTDNYNHRFNLRMEYTIDTMNSLIWVPRANLQQNSSDAITERADMKTGNTYKRTNSDALGYNFSNNINFIHKFSKKGRSVSLSVNQSHNYRDPNTELQADSLNRANLFRQNYVFQKKDNLVTGNSISSNIMYTEPIGKISLIQVNIGNNSSFNDEELITYNLLKGNDSIDTYLSYSFKSQNIANSAGVGYRINTAKLNSTFTLNYQETNLYGTTKLPTSSKIEQTYYNWLPMVQIRYKFSKNDNLTMNYRTYSSVPSISQLESFVDNGNLPDLSVGNPELKQTYTHNLFTRLSFTNPDKGTNVFMFVNGSYTLDPISTVQYTATKDSLITPNDTLKKGARLTKPTNLDHSERFSMLINYGFPLKFIKSNLNIGAEYSYSKSPGQLDYITYYSTTNSISPNISLSSNVSDKLDFSLQYSGGYNFVKNSVRTANSDYYSHRLGFKMTYIFWKGIVFNTDVSQTYQKYMSSTENNRNFTLWGLALGKKIFANQQGEIKLSVYDILKQNTAVSRSVNTTYIMDSRTNIVQRFVMLTFTYNLRQFSNKNNPDQQNDRQRWGGPRDHPPGGYGGGGGFGGPPGGMF